MRHKSDKTQPEGPPPFDFFPIPHSEAFVKKLKVPTTPPPPLLCLLSMHNASLLLGYAPEILLYTWITLQNPANKFLQPKALK